MWLVFEEFEVYYLCLLAKENHKVYKDMAKENRKVEKTCLLCSSHFKVWLVSEQFSEHYLSLLAKENRKVEKRHVFFRCGWFLNSLQSIIL